MQVLIFPTAGKLPYLNYVKTVEYAVDKIKFVDLLAPLEQELFLSSQRSHFGIWGVTDGNNNKNLDLWKQSEIGDTCLFYRNRKFYSKGKIFAEPQYQPDQSLKNFSPPNQKLCDTESVCRQP